MGLWGTVVHYVLGNDCAYNPCTGMPPYVPFYCFNIGFNVEFQSRVVHPFPLMQVVPCLSCPSSSAPLPASLLLSSTFAPRL